MDTVYADLINRLSKAVPDLRWIDLDQGQIDFPADNYPIDFPALLIDFTNTEWEDIGQQIQGGEMMISFRTAFRLYEDMNNHTPEESRNAGLQKLQLLKTIHKALQGFAGANYNRLSRIRTFTEKREDGLKVITMQYSTYITDNSARESFIEQKVDNLDVIKQ